jgi:hypothetical protein
MRPEYLRVWRPSCKRSHRPPHLNANLSYLPEAYSTRDEGKRMLTVVELKPPERTRILWTLSLEAQHLPDSQMDPDLNRYAPENRPRRILQQLPQQNLTMSNVEDTWCNTTTDTSIPHPRMPTICQSTHDAKGDTQCL